MRYAAALLAAGSLLAAPAPTYEVRRAGARIVIDGKVDDASWKDAAPITFEFPWEQQTGAKQKTVARLLWDDTFLYVSYECDDTSISAHYMNRDDPTYRDDAVEIFINPKPDQSSYYGLEMNALAVLYDYFMVYGHGLLKQFNMEGTQLGVALRGSLNVAGDEDRGWGLEVAIPWKNFDGLARTLPPAAGTIWTANLNRWDGAEPNRRLSQWSNSERPKPDPHNPDRFGKLVFVK